MGKEIDTLREKIILYDEVKGRIELMKKSEEDSEILIPEVREYITLGLQIIEKIRDELENRPAEPGEVKEEVFGEWRTKKKKT